MSDTTDDIESDAGLLEAHLERKQQMADTKLKMSNSKLITPMFRLAFPQVFEPKGYEGGAEKFSCVALFDKKTDLTELKKLVLAVANEKYGSKDKWPKGFKLPFRDGNEKAELEGYKDTIFVTLTSKFRPGVVDQNKAPITAEDQTFYAGCYARAQVNAFCYDKAGNKGVSIGLQNIQKMKDGAALSGRQSANEVFDSVDDQSDSDTDISDEDQNLDDLI